MAKEEAKFSIHRYLNSIYLPNGIKVENVPELKGAKVQEKLATIIGNFYSKIDDLKHKLSTAKSAINNRPASEEKVISKEDLIAMEQSRDYYKGQVSEFSQEIKQLADANAELTTKIDKLEAKKRYNTLIGKWFKL